MIKIYKAQNNGRRGKRNPMDDRAIDRAAIAARLTPVCIVNFGFFRQVYRAWRNTTPLIARKRQSAPPRHKVSDKFTHREPPFFGGKGS